MTFWKDSSTEGRTVVNSSTLQYNTTNTMVTRSKVAQLVLSMLIITIVIGLVIFLGFIILTFNIFSKTPTLRGNARYVLFVFLLFSDTLYLLVGFCLVLASIYLLYIPVPLCCILYTLSSATFKVTPYNLAAMALEQYIAICHPLRHGELCTTQRANIVFALICVLVIVPYVAEFYYMATPMTNIFKLYIICRQDTLVVNPIQSIVHSITLFLCFTSVGVIIIFTYVKIMQVAKRVSSQASSASKAGKTVMIHAFQLLLCTSALLSILTQKLTAQWPDALPTIHFFVFTCLPRFLSPMIYGIRDELLRQYMRKTLLRYFWQVSHMYQRNPAGCFGREKPAKVC